MTDWSAYARSTIATVATGLPETATLAERIAAVDAAYPFGPRSHWPYKAWLKARKSYLCRYGYKGAKPKPSPFHDWPRDPVTGRPVIE